MTRAMNATPFLRVFYPYQATSDPAADSFSSLTLRGFFESHVLPLRLEPMGVSDGTLREYRQSLSLWEEYTTDPPLVDIDDAACALFVHRLSRRPSRKSPGESISPNTTRKHVKNLRMMFGLAGRRSSRHPQAVGIVADVPYMPIPRLRHKPPTDAFTLAEIRAWLQVCKYATRPRIPQCRPAAWWRSLILFTYNSGCRIGTILGVERSWVTRSQDGSGWLAVPGPCYKGGQGRRIYLSAFALAALDSIPTRGRVWPWPHDITWLHDRRRAMMKKSDLPLDRRLGFHALRKALASQLYRMGQSAAAEIQLGHRKSITHEHYAHPDCVGPALAALPQP